MYYLPVCSAVDDEFPPASNVLGLLVHRKKHISFYEKVSLAASDTFSWKKMFFFCGEVVVSWGVQARVPKSKHN